MKIARRTILSIATVAPLAAALSATAQTTPKLPRVAYVWLFGDGPSAPFPESFRERMGQLGWIEGRNFVMERRDAGGSSEKLDAIMQEMVQSKVDIIVAMCSPEAVSAKKFTSTILIVVTASGDPVAAGLAKKYVREPTLC